MSTGDIQLHRRPGWCGSFLNPFAQLGKQSHRLLALTADAVAQTGDLEEAIEIVGMRNNLGDGVVVVFCAAKGYEFIILELFYSVSYHILSFPTVVTDALTRPCITINFPPAALKAERSA